MIKRTRVNDNVEKANLGLHVTTLGFGGLLKALGG